MKTKTLFIFSILFLAISVFAEIDKQTQTIRGKVRDFDSKAPLIGVALFIENSDPLIGTTTDLDGQFAFNNLPIGTYNITTQYLGYEPKTAFNVKIGAGKEVVLTIEITEAVVKMEEISITAKKNKAEALNTMATVSARSFTVEETNRYAGGLNDPSRMATSYAGVSADASGNNDIIIRGNSPMGLLWRMEGVDIPNPNHFANEGATGGPIGILNGNVLSNSDFFTSAFPAEYGNAYSGVFDINMRVGNNQKREYSFMLGVIGIDCSAEGPFTKNKNGSYLVNYRYSTLSLLDEAGIVDFGGIPKYQDLSFTLNQPTEKFGTFKMFGVGGISFINESDSIFDGEFGTNMGVIGLTNTYRFNNSTYIKSTIAATGSDNTSLYNRNFKTPNGNDNRMKWFEDSYVKSSLKATSNITKKINAQHTLKGGFTYSKLFYDMQADIYDVPKEKFINMIDTKGDTDLYQAYANWKYRVTEEITLTTGVHAMMLGLNNNKSIEPRIGAKWQFTPKQSINAGVGIHSKTASVSTYYAKDTNNVLVNKDLDFARARHYVIGYNNQLGRNVVFKSELYYQDLYNIPVNNEDNGTNSALNADGGYTTSDYVNKGTGKNYGMELTLEKFFSNSYYATTTASIFESKYTAMDGVERNSRFNSNYVFNVLGGKDFKLKSKKCCRTLSVSLKGTWAGGLYYTPIDIEASRITKLTEYQEDRAFSEKRDDYLKFDVKMKLTRERKKTTHSVELEIQNFTNNKTVTGEYYDDESDKIVEYYQLSLLPVISYRIEF